jgi:farnesyl diphosphate synthase
MSDSTSRPDTSFAARLAETASSIETALANLLDDRQRDHEIARPARLLAAMRHGALGGGKRLRPFLLTETARLFGVSPAEAMPAASAIELIHCYSLVHDDLPSMDNDDLRRGQPTVHKAFDEATAILAGDGLLTLAFEVLAGSAAEAAIPQPPELGIKAIVRPQSVQGIGRAHQLLVGSRNAGPVAVEVGQQAALRIGNGDAPHRSLASHGGKQPLLQRRTAQLSLQLGQANRWGQGR